MAYTGTDWAPSLMPGETDDFTLDFVKDLIPGTPLASLDLSAGGTGYSVATLVIGPPLPGGVQATGTASIDDTGAVSDPTLVVAGSRYLQPPPVSVIGDGSGAVVLAVLGSPESIASIVSVVVTDLNDIDPSPQSRAIGFVGINGSQVTQSSSIASTRARSPAPPTPTSARRRSRPESARRSAART